MLKVTILSNHFHLQGILFDDWAQIPCEWKDLSKPIEKHLYFGSKASANFRTLVSDRVACVLSSEAYMDIYNRV